MSAQHDDVPVSEARDRLADLIGQVGYNGATYYLTRRGRRVAALVPVDIAEAADAAEDAWLSRLAREAQAEVESGSPLRSFADVLTDLEHLDDADEHADEHDENALPDQRSAPTDTPVTHNRA